MDYKISKELLEKIAQYLVSKPWVEVNSLLQDLQKIQPIVEEKKE